MRRKRDQERSKKANDYVSYLDSLFGVPLLGTVEWDNRERRRERAGCQCLSFGCIPADGGKLPEEFWK